MRRRQQPTFLTPTMAAGLLLLGGAYYLGKAVRGLGVRLGKVEQEADYSKRDRQARSDRRDWWLGKALPATLGVVTATVAVIGLGTTQGWFH